MDKESSPTGLTRDVGWQVGARRTIARDLSTAWELITSREGLRLWLGETDDFVLRPGANYRTAEGVTGELRVLKPHSHLRLTWQPPDWKKASLIQVRLIPKGEKTVIAFHQEHLPDAETREERKRFFKTVLAELTQILRG